MWNHSMMNIKNKNYTFWILLYRLFFKPWIMESWTWGIPQWQFSAGRIRLAVFSFWMMGVYAYVWHLYIVIGCISMWVCSIICVYIYTCNCIYIPINTHETFSLSLSLSSPLDYLHEIENRYLYISVPRLND